MNRRTFVADTSTASIGALAFHIVPSRVLGGWRHIAPSDKLNIAYIGCGTQGLREMCQLIQNPKVQITSVCDVNKMSTNYVDWSPNGIRDGIRKILGASVQGLVALLSKDFIKLVLVAFIIASPIAWYFMNSWLQDFAYRINIEWWVFGAAAVVALVITFITISSQAIKAAIANPVKSLRTE